MAKEKRSEGEDSPSKKSKKEPKEDEVCSVEKSVLFAMTYLRATRPLLSNILLTSSTVTTPH